MSDRSGQGRPACQEYFVTIHSRFTLDKISRYEAVNSNFAGSFEEFALQIGACSHLNQPDSLLNSGVFRRL